MSKNRAIYKGYTAMELKTRSNIPAAADITVNASDIDCDNIATYDVRSVLGETTYDLEELCISVLTNMYSQFRNGWWILETGILVAKFPIQNFELDEWAGYNHSAPAPSKNNYNTGVSYPSGGSPTIYVTMEVGEIDWTDDSGVFHEGYGYWKPVTFHLTGRDKEQINFYFRWRNWWKHFKL